MSARVLAVIRSRPTKRRAIVAPLAAVYLLSTMKLAHTRDGHKLENIGREDAPNFD